MLDRVNDDRTRVIEISWGRHKDIKLSEFQIVVQIISYNKTILIIFQRKRYQYEKRYMEYNIPNGLTYKSYIRLK